MKLRFHARADLLVNDPLQPPRDGQAVARVGRKFIRSKKDDKGTVVEAARYEATAEPYEIDADTDAGRRLIKLVRREASLWPADKATAEACGPDVEFVPVELKDGEWVPKASKSKTKETA